MPRNKRKLFYTKPYTVRLSESMTGRLKKIAVRRRAKQAQIMRLAVSRGLLEMEQEIAEETMRYRQQAQIMSQAVVGAGEQSVEPEVGHLYQGQRARVKGLNAPDMSPDQTFYGQLVAVYTDELDGVTYATFAADGGPFGVIVVRMDGNGKLLDGYRLEVEDGEGENAHWREIDGKDK